MSLNVHSVIRRYMKDTSGFTLSDGTPVPVTLAFADGEAVIGWYRNPPPWERSLLVFTSKAIWTADDERTDRIPLAEITGFESPRTKQEVSGLSVTTRAGVRVLRCAGSYGPHGKYKDFLGLMMVLRAVRMSTAVE